MFYRILQEVLPDSHSLLFAASPVLRDDASMPRELFVTWSLSTSGGLCIQAAPSTTYVADVGSGKLASVQVAKPCRQAACFRGPAAMHVLLATIACAACTTRATLTQVPHQGVARYAACAVGGQEDSGYGNVPRGLRMPQWKARIDHFCSSRRQLGHACVRNKLCAQAWQMLAR